MNCNDKLFLYEILEEIEELEKERDEEWDKLEEETKKSIDLGDDEYLI